ncbi:hypothetical protein DPSP01_004346 [Paraphaeosphaeria sporulosa]
MEELEFHPDRKHPLTHNTRPWDSQLTLNHDPSTGRATYLQRWDPNTEKQVRNFVHDCVEEMFSVEGDLRDLNGRKSGYGEVV